MMQRMRSVLLGARGSGRGRVVVVVRDKERLVVVDAILSLVFSSLERSVLVELWKRGQGCRESGQVGVVLVL